MESLGPAMTVWVYGAESDINYASVSSVLARGRCYFKQKVYFLGLKSYLILFLAIFRH